MPQTKKLTKPSTNPNAENSNPPLKISPVTTGSSPATPATSTLPNGVPPSRNPPIAWPFYRARASSTSTFQRKTSNSPPPSTQKFLIGISSSNARPIQTTPPPPAP